MKVSTRPQGSRRVSVFLLSVVSREADPGQASVCGADLLGV